MRRIIDCHAHIFPEKIAEKASINIGAFYGLPTKFIATTKNLIKSGEPIGVTKFAVQSVATKADQCSVINNFILEEMTKHEGVIYGLGAMHPDLKKDEIDEIIKFVKANNLRGIKLHPDIQKFNTDDPKMHEIYDQLSQNELPLLIHSGDFRYDYSRPFRLANILKLFPKLKVIAAHFGGWMQWDEAMELLFPTNCFIDTSSTFDFIPRNKIREALNLFGSERVLFGSDYPMWPARYELNYLDSLALDEEVMDKILYKNCAQLLNI